MSGFDAAVKVILEHEGGYVNNPKDPGGETNFGIAKKFYPSEDIKNLTPEKAAVIYRRDYWDKIHGDLLNPGVALVVFDAAVNQGAGYAAKCLQEQCAVTADGVIGPGTAAAANKNPARTLERVMTARILRYVGTKNFDTFGEGWIKRCLRTYAAALKLV